MNDFEKYFVETNEIVVANGFKNQVLEINKNEPTLEFATAYIAKANDFLNLVVAYRNKQLIKNGNEKYLENNIDSVL
jgi:sulfite reductase (ferredoxin)